MYETQDLGDIESRFRTIRENPWEFLKILSTLDPADKKNPIKPFPVYLEYLHFFSKVWAQTKDTGRLKHPKILVPKSRRMRMTWVTVALYLWDTVFKIGRHNAFVSKKEDDSNELVKKAHFLLEHINHSVLPKEFIPKYELTFNKLIFPEINSLIQGFASGADQLRQFTFSGIFADELAFWDDAEKMYSASLPTIEGDGRFTGVSSPAPGFFKRLVMDQLDLDAHVVLDPSHHLYPCEGVELWKNEKNGFLIFQLHYKADPQKRDPLYIKEIKESMPVRQFSQEYELQWDSFEGLTVFADWDQTVHGLKKQIAPQIGLPLLLGFDWGLTPACIVCQMQEDTLCVLKEYTAVNMGAERFLSHLTPRLKIDFSMYQDFARDFLVFIDPAGFNRDQTDEGTCAKVLDSFGFRHIIPGPTDWEERKGSIEHFLTRRTRNGPCFQVSIPNCPVLVRGFQGGYRYDDKALDIQPQKLRPKKDQHSHIHDALQMVASRILITKPSVITEVPRLHYQWSSDREFTDTRFVN